MSTDERDRLAARVRELESALAHLDEEAGAMLYELGRAGVEGIVRSQAACLEEALDRVRAALAAGVRPR